MRTGFAVGLLAVAVALLVLGVLLFEARLIALAIPLAIYLAVGAVFAPVEIRVSVRRTLSSLVAAEGDRVTIRLQIRNQGSGVELLEIYDTVAKGAEVAEGSNYVVTPLRREGSLALEYTLVLPVTGRFTVGPLLLRGRDHLGFSMNELRVQDTATIVVSPGREDLRRVRLSTQKLRPWLGQIASRTSGLGTDFWAIRDYAAGDEMRRVNWKASARLDSLLTNEYEGERSGDFVLVLDAREEASLGQHRTNAVEMGVRGVISLAELLLDGRNRVGLIVMRSVLDWVYPDYGRKQLHRILDALIRVRPGGEWGLDHLPWILQRFFPPACQLIVISPVIDREALEAVEYMRAYGFSVVVISPSLIEMEGPAEEGRAADVARRLLRMERETNIALLRRFADVAEWPPGRPMALALKEVERWRTAGR